MEADLLRLVAVKQEAKEEVALVTVTSSNAMKGCRPGAMMVVDPQGVILGSTIGDTLIEEEAKNEAIQCISRGVSRKVLLNSTSDAIEVFIDAYSTGDKLVLVGSGPVILNVYQMAQMIGYCITVVDNRAETLTRERFPEARELLLGNIVEQIKSCEITDSTSIVIATYHHEYDEPALMTVIKSPARYIGALGNNRMVTYYYSKMNSLGVADEYINKFHTPVGLDLGGQKTAEIALAIVAEIQAVKYGCDGGFLTIKQPAKVAEKREELF
ncbi:MAG: XdhC/CoxI family protein [Syntrophomonas sp.]